MSNPTDDYSPPGEPYAVRDAKILEDCVGGDGSLWTYSATAGGYVSPDHPEEKCNMAAAIAQHTGSVRKANPSDYPT